MKFATGCSGCSGSVSCWSCCSGPRLLGFGAAEILNSKAPGHIVSLKRAKGIG